MISFTSYPAPASFAQQLPEMGGDAADERDRQPLGIAAQVALGEVAERAEHHPAYLRAADVVEDEGGERRQEAVGERFVIDAADDLLVGHPARFEEFPAQGGCVP